MGRRWSPVAILAGLALASCEPGSADLPPWAETVWRVHARFTGQKGTYAHFGDSITVTQAFWAPLLQQRKNASPEMERAFQVVKAHLRPECWGGWKGPEFGSDGGQTIRWAHAHVDEWLRALNPEMALIMFGTNDLHSLEADEYRDRLRAVVQRCLDNGTVVILNTIPPRHGFEEKAARFAEIVRELSREMKLPLVDYHAEVLRRRPKDWDGALPQFAAYEGYDVPTLISRDGVHPSYPGRYQGDYSDQALSRCGYGLRSYLVLMRTAEVIQVMQNPPSDERGEALRPPVRAWFPKAPPLPPPSESATRVGTVEALFQAVAQAKPGETVLLADGIYRLPRRLEIRTDRLTLRSASGNRERVILDGGGIGEGIAITACSGVTLADFTLQNIRWNGIKIDSETNVQRVTIRNLILHNIWQRAIKGVKVPEADRDRIRPTGFRIEYCLFYNDRPKTYADDPSDTEQTFGGNYIGGIDVMFARGWVISDNVFIGIRGRTAGARGAVFLWHETHDCIVERNVIVDCDSGICLGNSHKPDDVALHCRGCIVRNNFVTRAPEQGILADYTRDCKILNNTVCDPQNRLGRLIRLVHDNDGLLVANNLLCGPPMRNESQSRIELRRNVEQDLSAFLVSPEEGNLRLRRRIPEVVDQAAPLPDVREDIDRRPRGDMPDIGAWEWAE